MARLIDTAFGREALTFDDVLLRPGLSEVMPSETDVRSRVTRTISVNLPILSSAMDTVTEARLAIAMAQAGGMGVIHRNLTPEEQADQVRAVKKFESGMVVNPVTIHPDQTLAEAFELMTRFSISGIPVVERGPNGRAGKLVGILTNRDVRFATNPNQPVAELMTKERLVTVKEGVDQQEAKKLLHQYRIEKLLVVDENFRCTGLITVKDIEKAVANPFANKDDQGRLRVAAASTVGDAGFGRSEQLIDAGVDIIVIDTAHGHSGHVLRSVERVKKLSNSVQVMAGNVATASGTKALIDAGADAVKVGIGPGSICTTRIVAGVGVPQLTAVMEAAEEAPQARHSRYRRRRHQIFGRPRQGDRRRRRRGDGRLDAGRHGREPRRDLPLPGPVLQSLSRHGLGRCHVPGLGRPLFPAGHQGQPQAGAGRHRGSGAL